QIQTASGMIPLRGVRAVTIDRKGNGAPILASASPNPFNPVTMIAYSAGRDGVVTMRIYSIDGRLVRTLIAKAATVAGEHEVAWNGRDDHGQQVSSGIYFVRTTFHADATEASMVFKISVAK
ncbi:MAG TPA: FlgD immunoglobulin-like domain containing protein, partial [Candidatus Eisenbacteria bacterium]|nr:FlgD immunoglobulin-like domain containing protein [Candidatus Eisenbacteria bacterium]